MSYLQLNMIPISIIFTTITILSFGVGSYTVQSSFAHNFSPDESAHFLTIVDKINVESNLSAYSIGNNDQSSAQIHANNALLAYDHHTKEELAERNERVATELDDTLNQILEEVKSVADKAQLDSTVETIDAILKEAITTRIDEEQLNNSTIQALVFANIVDTALHNYGDAFNLDIDLTDIANINKSITSTAAANDTDRHYDRGAGRTQLATLEATTGACRKLRFPVRFSL